MHSIQISSSKSESIVIKCREVFSHRAGICGTTGNVQLDYNASRKGQCGILELHLEDVNCVCRQGETGRVGLPRLTRPYHSDHTSQGQQQTACFGKQTNACTHLYAHALVRTHSLARACWHVLAGAKTLPNSVTGRVGHHWCVHRTGQKTMFLYYLVKQWLSI